MTFSHAIVRTPCPRIVDGISSSNLGTPDYTKALEQHAAYTDALEQCGVTVSVLPPLDEFPDSTFVEDPALCTPRCAIVTRPGAPSRAGETEHIRDSLAEHFTDLETIRPPGTLEGGDVMMAGSHYFIGLTDRTNAEGVRQLIAILERYGMSGSAVAVKTMLHLKSGVAWLENDVMLATGEFVGHPAFAGFETIEVPAGEVYAANSIRVNDRVIVPAGYPGTAGRIVGAGFDIIEVDTSEFRKVDGGLSCLSLRFTPF